MKYKISIVPQDYGWVCIGENGEYIYEGLIHDSVADAASDLYQSYGGEGLPWEFEEISPTEFLINGKV